MDEDMRERWKSLSLAPRCSTFSTQQVQSFVGCAFALGESCYRNSSMQHFPQDTRRSVLVPPSRPDTLVVLDSC